MSLISIEEAKFLANANGVNVKELDVLLTKIQEETWKPLPEKYKIIFYLAMADLYTPEKIAKITGHSYKNIHSDFNKNLGQHLKEHFEFHLPEHFESQSQELRFGITSLRRTLFSLDQKYFYQNNDDDLMKILSKRPKENSDVKKDLKVEENIHDIHDITH